MPKPTVLLTGATGFLGSHLLEVLIKKNFQVVALKRTTSNPWRIQSLAGQYKSFDVDIHSVEQIFEEQRIDCVIHTACNYGRNASAVSEVVETNLIFGLKLLEVGIKKQVTTFINTDSFLPKYTNAYSLSKKHLVEWLKLQSNSIQVINLKLEHMYGPKDDETKFIAWLVAQLKQKAPQINLTSGIQRRDFIYIDDVVSAIVCVLNNTDGLKRFNEFEVGSGESIQVKTFVENLKHVFEKHHGKSSTQLNFGAIAYRTDEIMNFNVNNQPLRQLGWKPKISLLHGLEQTLRGSL